MAAATLFSLQFHTDIADTQALFFRGSAAVNESGALVFGAGGTAAFDTYFNLFSHEKYAKYCGITSARLRLNGRGQFRVKLFRKAETGDELLKSADFCDWFELVFDFPAGGGFLWFSLEAPAGGELYSGAFEADIPAPNEVKLGVVICTYKREAFVARNMERVQKAISAAPEWADRLHFFIADNAKTLNLPEDPLYTVIPNKNLGGSGGFTRGIVEVCGDASFTHFLLMDDDISFEFATLERTYHLLCALSPAHKSAAVGGAMLVLERPTEQYEFGARFTGLSLHSHNSRYDLADANSLLANERVPAPNFLAWWYACMPVSFVQDYGLPMPFFIKGDDIEYGLRCVRDSILLNGIGIWHQDFSSKYNYALEYYLKRNEQILTAMHISHGRIKSCVRLLYAVFLQLALRRYDCAELILRAYEDFFRGSEYLNQIDAEALNAEIMAHKPEYEDLKELEARCGVSAANAPTRRSEKKRPLSRALALFGAGYLPALFCKKGAAACDANETLTPKPMRCRTIVHCDSARGLGYACTLDTKRRAKIRRRAWKYFFKLLFGFGKFARDYRENRGRVCSGEEWNRRFGL